MLFGGALKQVPPVLEAIWTVWGAGGQLCMSSMLAEIHGLYCVSSPNRMHQLEGSKGHLMHPPPTHTHPTSFHLGGKSFIQPE